MKTKFQIVKIAILIFSIFTSFCLHFVSFQLRYNSYLEHRKQQWRILQQAVDNVIKKFKGKTGVVIMDLDKGWIIAKNQRLKFPAASIIKLPIAIVVEKAIREGGLSPIQVIKIKPIDIVGGSGVIRHRKFPQQYTVGELVDLMLTVSDNTACNMLIKLLGINTINTEMEKLGLKDTCLKRFMMDFKARSRGIENYTSARDIATAWYILYLGEVLGNKNSKDLIDVLKNQKVRDRISKLVGDKAVVANKTGLERNVCHDSGIIFTPYGDILIVVLTSDFKSFKVAKEFIATLGFLGYNYLLQSGYEPQRFIQHSYSPVSG